MFNLKRKKNGFTLAETVIVCSVFAVMVLGIIFAINRAYIFLNDTRLRVIATNFSREGVEMIYNVRDTNRRQNPGDRDQHRMDRYSGLTGSLLEGIYTIKEGKTASGDSYIYLTGLGIDSSNVGEFYEIEGFFDESNIKAREESKLTFTGSYSYKSGGTIATGDLNEFMNGFGATFYRVVRVYGVYKKNGTSSPDTKAVEEDMTNGTPVELRFCVKVFYDVNGGHHSNELCSIMTNFMK